MYFYQAFRAWFADWRRDQWTRLREFARAQWSKVRARNTGDR